MNIAPIFFGRRQNLDGDFKYFLFSPYSTWGRNLQPILTVASFSKRGCLLQRPNLEKHLDPNVWIFSPHYPVILGVKSLPISFFGFDKDPKWGAAPQETNFCSYLSEDRFRSCAASKTPRVCGVEMALG